MVFKMHLVKVLQGKSCHFAVVLPMAPGSYFRLTRPEPFRNEWGDRYNFTFNGHWDIKTEYIESPINSDKNHLKSLVTLHLNKVQNVLLPTSHTSTTHVQWFTT